MDDNIENIPLIAEAKAGDIFTLSSKTIKEIVDDCYEEETPNWIRELKLDYYFETLAEQNIKQKITTMWNANPKMFTIDRRANLLTIDTGDYHEANRIVGELPSYIQRGNANGVISLDLNYAEKYFQHDFKLGFINRIFSR